MVRFTRIWVELEICSFAAAECSDVLSGVAARKLFNYNGEAHLQYIFISFLSNPINILCSSLLAWLPVFMKYTNNHRQRARSGPSIMALKFCGGSTGLIHVQDFGRLLVAHHSSFAWPILLDDRLFWTRLFIILKFCSCRYVTWLPHCF